MQLLGGLVLWAGLSLCLLIFLQSWVSKHHFLLPELLLATNVCSFLQKRKKKIGLTDILFEAHAFPPS